MYLHTDQHQPQTKKYLRNKNDIETDQSGNEIKDHSSISTLDCHSNPLNSFCILTLYVHEYCANPCTAGYVASRSSSAHITVEMVCETAPLLDVQHGHPRHDINHPNLIGKYYSRCMHTHEQTKLSSKHRRNHLMIQAGWAT